MKRVATILCLISFALLAGCAHLDPWNEFKRMPASRSQSFEGDITVDEPADEKDTQSTVELSGRTLYLTECITIALEHNPRTAASWQAIRVAAARVGQAKAEYLPSIGFTSSARRSDVAELDTKADQASGVSVPSLTGNTIDSDGSASSAAQSIASSVSKSIASRLAEAIVGTSEAQDDPGDRPPPAETADPAQGQSAALVSHAVGSAAGQDPGPGFSDSWRSGLPFRKPPSDHPVPSSGCMCMHG